MTRHIKYWIVEFKFSEEKKKALDEIATQYNMTYDEIFDAALRQVIDYPDEFASMYREYQEKHETGETEEEIKFIREYPVYEGETETEARDRALSS